MDVIVNGERRQVVDGLRLTDLVPDPRGVAVAVNGAVVRSADWTETELRGGDRVEVVTAHQGG
jgi:sulfur carrier protein